MKVAAINDMSGFGKCSLVADISVLASLGVEVCPVPTAIFTAQTGFPSYHMHDMTEDIPAYTSEWKKMNEHFDGILTGYMPNEVEVDHIIDFVKTFYKEDTILLVDPVMGDGGHGYSNFSSVFLEKIRELSEMADILTPNLTELCFLAGEDAEKLLAETNEEKLLSKVNSLAQKVRKKDNGTVVVTGLPLQNEGEVGNYILSETGDTLLRAKCNKKSYSGTGDLFAASLLGNILQGKDIVSSTSLTADFIIRAIYATAPKDRNYGIDYELVLQNNRT